MNGKYLISATLGLVALICLTSDHICSATYLQSCTKDGDCSFSTEQCLTLTSMGCTSGYCACKSGTDYNFNRTRCVTAMTVALGEICTGADYEQHVSNAGCYFGISSCFFGYTRSNGVCSYNYGKTCTDASTDCGYQTPFICSSGTCQCGSAYKKNSNGICVAKDIGDTCTTASDCAALSPTVGTGYACTGGLCACSSGYQAIQITDVDVNEADASMKTTTANYCFSTSVGSTFNVTNTTGSCNMWPYSTATSKVSTCAGTSYGCYICPEMGTSATTGLCRKTTTTVPSCTSMSGCTSATTAATAGSAAGQSKCSSANTLTPQSLFSYLPSLIFAAILSKHL